MPKAKVYMFVYNNCTHDARVLKEAKTLADAGYDVRIIAVLDKNTTAYEEREGFKIIRVKKNPIHYRVLQTLRHPASAIKKLAFWIIGIPVKLLAYIFFLFWRKPLRKKKALSPFPAKTLAWKLRRLLADFLHRALAHLKQRHRIAARAFLKGLRLYKKALHLFVAAYRKATRVVHRMFVNYLVNYGVKKFLMVFHRPLCFWDYYRRSYQIVKQDPADIYHAHDLNTLPVAWWARKRLGGKLVYDSHELYTEITGLTRLERLLARLVERSLISTPNKIITVNHSIANQLQKRYGPISPTIIMNCPVATDHFDLVTNKRKLIPIDPVFKVVIYQGGFSPGRGLLNLLEAMKFISTQEVMLVLIGWGKLEDDLKKRVVADAELRRRVIFLPPVSPNKLVYVTREANIGVIPFQKVSLNNYYGLPNKLFEYIAAGIPVAASNFPELRKIVLGHQLGEVFDPEDPKDIARAIDSILSDHERYRSMKENARKAAQIYNWENESRKLLRIYAELTEEGT